MDNTAKIQFSPEEAELVNNTEWILTKHAIIKKVYEMFGGINEMMKQELADSSYLFSGIECINGKISKGENYLQLPYIILDYPYSFYKNNFFAVRTMFWWGNFFSVTLHLSGNQKEKFINNKSDTFSFLKKNNFSVCINSDEWQHHFEKTNYVAAATLTITEFEEITKKLFFKVARQLPISEWKVANNFIIECFKEIVMLLKINFPNDKKDL